MGQCGCILLFPCSITQFYDQAAKLIVKILIRTKVEVFDNAWMGTQWEWVAALSVPHTVWSDCLPHSQHHHISKPNFLTGVIFCGVSERLSLGVQGGFL